MSLDVVCIDSHIRGQCKNSSFGYGEALSSKRYKTVLVNYKDVLQTMIKVVVYSNEIQKEHIAYQIISKNPKTVVAYRLIIKIGSTNFLASAIQNVMKYIKDEKIPIIIYEPKLNDRREFEVINNIDCFKRKIMLFMHMSSMINNYLSYYLS